MTLLYTVGGQPRTIDYFSISQVDLVLGGYQVPRGTCVLVDPCQCGSERNYPGGGQFLPERWLPASPHYQGGISWAK